MNVVVSVQNVSLSFYQPLLSPLTLVIVDSVITYHLELHGAVVPVPAFLTAAVPLPLVVSKAHTVVLVTALRGATRNGAVAAVVARHAHARPVHALSVHVAPERTYC